MATIGGETNVPIGDWTTGTLKIFHDDKIASVKELLESELCAVRKTLKESDRRYQQQFEAQEKSTLVAINSSQDAVAKADAATEKRFEGVNEFRSALNDQSKHLVSRNEVDSLSKSLMDKIESNTTALSDLRSRLDVGNPAIGTIQQQLANSQGVSQGETVTMAKIYAAIGIAVSVIGLIVLLVSQVVK